MRARAIFGVLAAMLMLFTTLLVAFTPQAAAISNTYRAPYYGYSNWQTWNNGYWSGVWNSPSPYYNPNFNMNTGIGVIAFDAFSRVPSPNGVTHDQFKQYFNVNVDHYPRMTRNCQVDFTYHARFQMIGSLTDISGDIEHTSLHIELFSTARVWDATDLRWINSEVWYNVWHRDLGGSYSNINWDSGLVYMTWMVSCYAPGMRSDHHYQLVTSLGGYADYFLPSWQHTEGEYKLYVTPAVQSGDAWLNSVVVTYL